MANVQVHFCHGKWADEGSGCYYIYTCDSLHHSLAPQRVFAGNSHKTFADVGIDQLLLSWGVVFRVVPFRWHLRQKFDEQGVLCFYRRSFLKAYPMFFVAVGSFWLLRIIDGAAALKAILLVNVPLAEES